MQLCRCRCRALRRGVFVRREGAAPLGRCLSTGLRSVSHSPLRRRSDRRRPPFKVNGCAQESCNLPEFAKCSRSRREQRQRGKYSRNTELLAAASTLSSFGRGCADVRGATASGASAVDPREEGESCSSWRGHFS